MEIVEMDLMQAQIGELTTEVTAANNKIAKMPSIPTPKDTDAGKVIKVSETGEYELGEAGGGGGTNTEASVVFINNEPSSIEGLTLNTRIIKYGILLYYIYMLDAPAPVAVEEYTVMYYDEQEEDFVYLPEGTYNMYTMYAYCQADHGVIGDGTKSYIREDGLFLVVDE